MHEAGRRIRFDSRLQEREQGRASGGSTPSPTGRSKEMSQTTGARNKRLMKVLAARRLNVRYLGGWPSFASLSVPASRPVALLQPQYCWLLHCNPLSGLGMMDQPLPGRTVARTAFLDPSANAVTGRKGSCPTDRFRTFFAGSAHGARPDEGCASACVSR